MFVLRSTGHKVSAYIQEDEEALIIGCKGSVSSQAPPLLAQALQVDNMQVNLLSDGRRRHGVRDHAASWPRPTVHVQVPVIWGQTHAYNVAVDVDHVVQRIKELLCAALLSQDRPTGGHLVRHDPLDAYLVRRVGKAASGEKQVGHILSLPRDRGPDEAGVMGFGAGFPH